jgi:hypothetical protein
MLTLWFSSPVWLGSLAVIASRSTMPVFDRIVIISFMLLLAVIVGILRFG